MDPPAEGELPQQTPASCLAFLPNSPFVGARPSEEGEMRYATRIRAKRASRELRAFKIGAAVASVALGWAFVRPAPAGLAFKSGASWAVLTHDRDVTTTESVFTRSPAPVPAQADIYPVAADYQLRRRVDVDADSLTRAVGSLGHVTNATTASF